jgi:tRNA G37 N-methylase Trm5
LFATTELQAWLATLVNERHVRNWSKIDRFVQAVRAMPAVVDDLNVEHDLDLGVSGLPPTESTNGLRIPRSFDVVGDVAVLHSLAGTTDPAEQQQIGQAIMKKNKAIKVVLLRQHTMEGTERAPGNSGFITLAGPTRSPLITTHNEHGIKCVVDLEHTFFSPRMGAERLRICQQVARGEHVLVLFCGVGMDAMQIAGRTEATSVVAVELNEVAIKCARLGHRMLERNKAVKCVGAAERLQIIQGDVLQVLPTLPRNHFDRIVAPRPKEGSLDGDLGTGEGGLEFLQALLPVLKQDGGECHWYEFVADHEFPTCTRSRELLHKACAEQGLGMEVIHVANAGSVAMRQLRVCIDFRVFPER